MDTSLLVEEVKANDTKAFRKQIRSKMTVVQENISASREQHRPPLISNQPWITVLSFSISDTDTVWCISFTVCPINYLFKHHLLHLVQMYSKTPTAVSLCVMFLSRHVVPASCGLLLLPAPHPSVGHNCASFSTNQRGPKVWLAACDFSHVHQQVSPVTTQV